MIESYSFGRMKIAGRLYTADLIIYPDGAIVDSWWRQSGHYLIMGDILSLVATAPECIVAGTGASGLMKPAPELAGSLKTRGIEFIAMPTSEAAKLFNELHQSKKLGACFHLTC